MLLRLWLHQVTAVTLVASVVILFIGIVGDVPRTEIIGAGMLGGSLLIRRVWKRPRIKGENR